MKIYLYKNYSVDDEVSKTIVEEIELDCILKSESGVTITNPVVDLAGDYAVLASYNYAYIPDFNRYYYITDVNFYRAGVFSITLRCDVLMSFWDEFKGNQAIVDRQENIWNKNIPDNTVPIQADTIFDRYVINVPEFQHYTLLAVGSTDVFEYVEPEPEPEE